MAVIEIISARGKKSARAWAPIHGPVINFSFVSLFQIIEEIIGGCRFPNNTDTESLSVGAETRPPEIPTLRINDVECSDIQGTEPENLAMRETEFGNRRNGIWQSKDSDGRTEGMRLSKRWHRLGESVPDKM
jgi:hypothetical protein